MPSHTAFYPFERLVNARAEIPANGALVKAKGCIGLVEGYSGSYGQHDLMTAATGAVTSMTDFVRGAIYMEDSSGNQYVYSGTRTKLWGDNSAPIQWFTQSDL